jgi:hypothetical protein
MAEDEEKDEEEKPDKLSPKKKEELLKRAKDRLKLCTNAEKDNRKAAIDDLKFLNGEQWDEAEKQRRKNKKRPILVVDFLNKFIKQATGDARQNKPRIKITPLDAKGTVHVANIREGLVRSIEYNSNAEAIYDQAFDSQVSCGYGAWRVNTRYRGPKTFDEEIYLELLRNPFCAYLQPDCSDMVSADAEYGFIMDKMSPDDFKKKYPKADMPGDGKFDFAGTDQAQYDELWYTQEQGITVAEYYEKEFLDKTIVQLSDGRVMDEEEGKKEIEKREDEISAFNAQQMALESAQLGGIPGAQQVPEKPQAPEPLEISKKRDSEDFIIKHYIITSVEILEGPVNIPGKFIPIVITHGEERNIAGKNHVRGLIRNAKDPQRILNYWSTAAAEIVALAPKAPFIGTDVNFAGFEDDWKNANTENFPFLKYTPDERNNNAPPTRNSAVDGVPAGIFTEIGRAEQNIYSAIGMAPVDLGMNPGQERSGIAVRNRQRPSDVVTFIYIDNLARSIAHTGRIINSMIPEVHDTDQDAMLRGPDGTQQFVPVNTTVGGAIQRINETPERFEGMDLSKLKSLNDKYNPDTPFNDLTEGEYAATVEIGPSFATQRMESADNLIKLMQYMPPNIRNLAADLVANNLDFKDAEEFARRVRLTLPPGIVPPEPGQKPLPQPPQMKMMMQKMQDDHNIKMKKLENEQKKLQTKNAELALQIQKVTNEKSKGTKNVRAQVISILKELQAPPGHHPSDHHIAGGPRQ